MRTLSVIVFSLFIHTVLFAQTGHEWINFGQSYFKIPVGKDGLYKLSYTDLQSAGFSPESVDPKTIQLYHRGQEHAIFVNGEQDNQFDPGDYILFYGQKNDGTLDAELYKPASSQPHTYHNLYSDTTSYFLTTGTSSGKRMTSFSELNSGLPKEEFHLDEKLLLLTSQYSLGIDYGEVHNTFFDLGEGWMGPQITQGGTIVPYALNNITQTVTTSSPPQLEVLLVGRGPMEHQVEIYAGARLLETVNFSGFNAYKYTTQLAWSDITAGSLTVGVKVTGIGGEPDRISVGYCRIQYAQGFNAPVATEKIFYIPENPSGKAYVEIQSPPSGVTLWDITDPGEVVRIGTTLTGTLNAVIPATGPRKILATTTTITPEISPVTFRQINPGQHDYIVITHPLLRRSAGGYSDPVEAYAAYRASDAGGGYDTLVLNIQQVYDQFNYGEKSPLGIFHFMKFLAGIKLPKYLFLVGKGLEVYYGYYRNPAAFTSFQDLVPSAGYPASDMAFTTGLSGTTFEPAVPTGRITASTSQQVADYLNKVIEMEALPFDALWRKNILHLSGGIKPGEPQLFKSYMQDFQATAEDYYFGAKVTAAAKNTLEIQPINISDQVNKGLHMISFFGHSAPTAMDYEIGYVSHPANGFSNKGKYPLILVNGCEAGAAFLYGTVFGEDWVLTPDKGSIGFISHSAYGFISELRKYTENFYNVGFADSANLSKGIGDIQKETARRFMEMSSIEPMTTSQVQQMILLGDPAYSLFGAKKPDLEINDNNVYLESLDGKPITTFSDSFAIKMIVRNFGQARESAVKIQVTRTFGDNSSLTYDSLFDVPKYMDTLTFIIRNDREQTAGSNSFRITIDPDGSLSELTKSNNEAMLGASFILNGTKNLFPSAFAIVKDKEISLSFQTNDLLSDEREFLVELDTTNTFDSPYKQAFVIRGTVLVRQAISLLDNVDTLAYYWRTKLSDPLPDENQEWTTSSFSYINEGPEGWAQVHFPQYLGNSTDGILADSTLKKFVFEKNITTVSVRTYGSQFFPTPETDLSVKIDGFEYNYSNQGFGCRSNTINLVAFDRKSGTPYIGLPFEWFENFGRDCGRQPFVINNFAANQLITGNGDDIVAYIDEVAEGDSVLMFTIGDPGFSTWPAAAKLKFNELGVSIEELESYPQGTPLVFFGRKGSPAGTAQVFAPTASPSNQQMLEVTRTITSRSSSGKMESTVVGPAQHWQSFKATLSDLEASDVIEFEITGIDTSGDEVVLFPSVTGTQDLTSVSALDFPYLKISYRASDDINVTAAQLDKWLVLFTPVPEGLLIYKGPLEQSTLREGQDWFGNYGFTNISDKLFTDSLTVRVETFTTNTRTSEVQQFKIIAPAPGDTTDFQVRVNTLDKVGLNDVKAAVNPEILPEQYYDNNVLEMPGHLDVLGESNRPVLQVSIDGRQLENGDVVSPNPSIKIILWDGNDDILKTDTLGITILLTAPCETDCIAKRISLSGDNIIVYPATANSDFRIDFTPLNLAEGVYTLRVEATDAKGNESGAEPYSITFEVKHEKTVRLHPPYPNPSKHEVYFPIEITGDVLPEEVDISITHVNGQTIARFTRESFLDMHSGKNTLTWDGADVNGNPLPNGIYIYKEVITLNQVQTIRHGKVVLLR